MVGMSPMVFILGSTGSGKTKLSLQLAKKFGGEIIGADSMQIYKGLDIITAKATKEEQSVAPHHMIDILEPHEKFTVVNYRNMALDIINKIVERKHLPIIVGGTNYYIESLIWKVLVDYPDSQWVPNPGTLPNDEHKLSSKELHNKLKSLDPETAKRLHPNNKRKIIRALEVYLQSGKKLSEILSDQVQNSGSTTGGSLRFPNSLVFWLQCDQEILDQRLYDRVDSMIEQRLIKELVNFHNLYSAHSKTENGTIDYTKGIFQSIGFKEFHSYLELNETQRDSPEGLNKLQEGIELLKIATRQYARKQNKWTLHRFLGRPDRKAPPIYALDTTDVSLWTSNVTTPAIKVLESYINGTPCEILPLQPRDTKSTSNLQDDSHYCDVCEKVFVGNHQWQQHLVSVRHKKVDLKRKKQKLLNKT